MKLGDVCAKGKSNLRQKDLKNDGPYPVYGASGIVGFSSDYQNADAYVAVVKDGAGVGRVMACEPRSSVLGTMQALLPGKGTERDYLLHLVRSMDLGKGFTGSTIPHIYFKDYGKTLVRALSREQQVEVANRLSGIDHLISQGKGQLSLLDDLVKSQFIEMFGTLEEPRSGIELKTIDSICTSIVRGPFGSALKKEYFVPWHPGVYKVYEQKNAIRKQADIGDYYIEEAKFGELGRFECVPGDILMSCSGTMGELYQLPNDAVPGVINQALCKFTLDSKQILAPYFLEIMSQAVGELGAKGSGIQNIASVKYVKAVRIPVPPVELQRQFADLVARVDKLGFGIWLACKSLHEPITHFYHQI